MTNRTNTVLYIGITNNLARRMSEHNEGRGAVFTAKYNCDKLVYYEVFPDIEQAIAREKQLKHFERKWKEELVNKFNPEWKDLGESIISNPEI